jgi:hypothetical protein
MLVNFDFGVHLHWNMARIIDYQKLSNETIKALKND